MRSSNSRFRGRRGFILLEILLATALFGLVAVSLVTAIKRIGWTVTMAA